MRFLTFCLLLLAAPAWAGQFCRAQVTPVAGPLNPCQGADRVSIAAVGDVLLHRPLQARGYVDPAGFFSIWAEAAPLLTLADIAYANLEGPTAAGITRAGNEVRDPGPVFDDRVYSSFPMFNYHPRVIGDLQRAGIDIVSTANNHALDRQAIGANRTIDSLRAAGMPYTGTIKAGAPRLFTTLTPSPLGQIAWIACSYSTNGLADPHRQMLMCHGNRTELLAIVAQAAAHPGIAAVIVTPHWGVEYSHSPSRIDRALARDLMAAGATAVIGTHPHVVQPWEALTSAGGAQGLAIYSTGNFVSSQVSLARRTGAIAWLQLCRPPPAANIAKALRSKLVVAETGWVPVRMVREAGGPRLKVGAAAGQDALRLLQRYLPKNGIKAEVACHAQDATLVSLQ